MLLPSNTLTHYTTCIATLSHYAAALQHIDSLYYLHCHTVSLCCCPPTHWLIILQFTCIATLSHYAAALQHIDSLSYLHCHTVSLCCCPPTHWLIILLALPHCLIMLLPSNTLTHYTTCIATLSHYAAANQLIDSIYYFHCHTVSLWCCRALHHLLILWPMCCRIRLLLSNTLPHYSADHASHCFNMPTTQLINNIVHIIHEVSLCSWPIVIVLWLIMLLA
jgi:hypothetical protein